MRTHIQKWGNGLALRIRKSFAAESSIGEGSVVDLSVTDGNLVVKPVTESVNTLDELLAGVTKHNTHEEVRTGKAVGNELL